MINFQSIQTTTDSMATGHASRAWTLLENGKSSHKTAEGDSNTLDGFRVQDTQSEVTSAISA